MKTIQEKEFERLCREVRRDSGAVLNGVTEPSERTRRLLQALLARVCAHLDLDLNTQIIELGDDAGFALMQTLEEHMQPEFTYGPILDRYLLANS
jgi:hypothetical protein